MQDEIIAVYNNEEDIKKLRIKLESFSFDKLIKKKHFYYSIEEKNQKIDFLKEKFKEFFRIKLIVKRKHKSSSKESYDFYYLLDDETYILYAIAFEGEDAILLNSFNVQRSFSHFRKSLIKGYKKQFTG